MRKNPDNSKKLIGVTNLEAALKGYAPEMADGSLVNLHHVGQHGLGPLAEVSEKSHTYVLHKQFKGKKHPVCPAIHDEHWNADKASYWKRRAENVSKK